MEARIKVRHLPDDNSTNTTQASPQVESLPLREAVKLIVDRKAEPVVEFQDHAPKLPLNGMSLAEAFHLYVAQHPTVMKGGGLKGRYRKLRVRKYLQRPLWANVKLSKLRELLGGFQVRRLTSFERSYDSEERQVIVRPPARTQDLSIGLNNCIRSFHEQLAIYCFLKRLQDGQIGSSGVAEADLATLEAQGIPPAWRGRDIRVHLLEGEIWEHFVNSSRTDKRYWSQVNVMAKGLKDARLNPKDVTRTGAPGRPTCMHIIQPEFRRRVENGEIEPTLAAQSKVLAAWFEKSYPDLPRPTPKTIANKLRDDYN